MSVNTARPVNGSTLMGGGGPWRCRRGDGRADQQAYSNQRRSCQRCSSLAADVRQLGVSPHFGPPWCRGLPRCLPMGPGSVPVDSQELRHRRIRSVYRTGRARGGSTRAKAAYFAQRRDGVSRDWPRDSRAAYSDSPAASRASHANAPSCRKADAPVIPAGAPAQPSQLTDRVRQQGRMLTFTDVTPHPRRADSTPVVVRRCLPTDSDPGGMKVPAATKKTASIRSNVEPLDRGPFFDERDAVPGELDVDGVQIRERVAVVVGRRPKLASSLSVTHQASKITCQPEAQ